MSGYTYKAPSAFRMFIREYGWIVFPVLIVMFGAAAVVSFAASLFV